MLKQKSFCEKSWQIVYLVSHFDLHFSDLVSLFVLKILEKPENSENQKVIPSTEPFQKVIPSDRHGITF